MPGSTDSKETPGECGAVAMDEFNRHPVVHTWSYKLDEIA